MSFGRVFTIRFKLILVFVLVPFSSLSYGLDTKESLQVSYLKAYENLNSKVGECSILKKERALKVEDHWLKSLPTLTQKVVLFELSKAAEKRCAQIEESSYINILVELAVIGETEALYEYLKLRQYDLPKEDNRRILDELDQLELQRLSTLDKYQQPFNVLLMFKN